MKAKTLLSDVHKDFLDSITSNGNRGLAALPSAFPREYHGNPKRRFAAAD